MGQAAVGEAAVAPARAVLATAEWTARRAGHENAGFLSEAAGFMPLAAPAASLPSAFGAWDEVAAELPRLYGTLGLRRRLLALPNLRGEVDGLPDSALLRAGHLLAMLSHAYQYVETVAPPSLPPALTEPWAEVRRRLDRQDAVLNYIDLIVYNFRLLDPHVPNPFRVENLRLLTPTVDTDEERVFYLTQTEILAQTGPVIGAVVRAQEAVLNDDPARLVRELLLVIERLEHVVRTSLLKINPNPSGANFVNPVVWAKTVAPFAVPIEKGVQGPSGTSSPIFSLLDAFFERKRNETFLGREIRDLRRGYPRFWREFIACAGEVSIKDYIDRTGSRELSNLWNDALSAYAGNDGFLGRHRMKVYGYLELAFKVGRSVTIGGFAGLFKDRTWDQVDSELEYSRRERLESFPETCRFADVKAQPAPVAEESELSRRVVLGVEGASLRYQPGDRCGVLAENDDELVARTLAALEANGDEPVELTSEWIEHLRLRPGFEGRTRLALRNLLRFGRIRPVIPRVAEALHAVTQNPALLNSIVAQTTTRDELWELLLEVAEGGFDVKRLWQGPVTSSGYICRVLPPENFRMYSISSAMRPGAKYAEQLELTVGLVRYRSAGSKREPERVRAGTASNFLGAAPNGRSRVPFVIQHPARFGLPEDTRTPIVLLAGGTGVAPFLSFIRSRLEDPNSGPCLLFWGIRSRADFLDRELLARAVAAGKLELHVAFSREESAVEFRGGPGGGDFEFLPGKSAYADQLLLRDDNAPKLLRLLASRLEGGLGAHVYVCGRSRFARSVDQALRALITRGYGTRHERAIDHILAGWVGEGRYLREIYTDPHPHAADEPQFDVSEIVTKNDEGSGYWFVIDGRVYDLTAFLGMHPGGLSVLRGYAGMDATQGYQRAHARATEVDAMREMYGIGKLRTLDFHGESRVVERGPVTHRMSLSTLHRAWVSFLYLVVEMQNALRNDLGLKESVTARGEPVAPRSPYKIERLIETQERFSKSYTGGLAGPPAIDLWELTEGMYRGRASSFMHEALAYGRGSAAHQYTAMLTAELRADLELMLAGEGDAQSELGQRLRAACEQLEAAAHDFLAHVKSLFREALRLFERHQSAVLEQAGAQLLQILAGLPDALAAYTFDVQKRLQSVGYRWVLERESVPSPALLGPAREVLAHTRYWLMELDRVHNIVFFRRSAEPLRDLPDLVSENERIIEKIRETQRCRGAVVDTREAPQRNDPEFEDAMRRMRNQVCGSYARVAVLLVTAVGVLQVSRLGRDDDAPTLVTQSEAAAIQFATGTH